MATLTGLQIDASYLGLIKTTDNAALTGTAKAITDGNGGATNITMSTTASNFVSGTVDFTGSTVSGIPGALRAGSLEPGNFANNFQNVATPGGTPTSSIAYGWQSMAFGHAANSQGARSVAIGIDAKAGTNADPGTGGQVSIGWNPQATGTRAIGIGGDNTNILIASGDDSIAMGAAASATTTASIAIGKNAVASGLGAIMIGTGTAAGPGSFNVGNANVSTGERSVALGGFQNSATGTDCISMGGFGTQARGLRSAAIGGQGNIAQASFSGCFAGNGHQANHEASVTIGGATLSTQKVNEVVVPKFRISTTGALVTDVFQIDNYSSLDFTNDTTAAAGGVPLGGVYHNGGAMRIRVA